LADANKDHAQREQAVAERLHTMSTAAESKCFTLPSIFDFCCTVVLAEIFLFLFYLLCVVQDLPGYLRRPCHRTMIL
jgi:hypothetical protein